MSDVYVHVRVYVWTEVANRGRGHRHVRRRFRRRSIDVFAAVGTNFCAEGSAYAGTEIITDVIADAGTDSCAQEWLQNQGPHCYNVFVQSRGQMDGHRELRPEERQQSRRRLTARC